MTRTCSAPNCNTVLGPANRSGLCRPCFLSIRNADPEFQARRIAASREGKKRQSPESKRRAARVIAAKRLAKPEYREWLAMHMRSIAPLAHAPAPKASRAAKLSLAVSDARLPWCPREHRPLYRELTRKGLRPAEARAVVEAEIAREKAQAAASDNSFKAKLARVLAGQARVVPSLNRRHLEPMVRS